jgi:hypothetical protein
MDLRLGVSYEGGTRLQLLENGALRRKSGLKMIEKRKMRGEITWWRDFLVVFW